MLVGLGKGTVMGDIVDSIMIQFIHLSSRPLKLYFSIKPVLTSSILILFIRYKRTLIALLKLYAAAANNTLITSPFTPL